MQGIWENHMGPQSAHSGHPGTQGEQVPGAEKLQPGNEFIAGCQDTSSRTRDSDHHSWGSPHLRSPDWLLQCCYLCPSHPQQALCWAVPRLLEHRSSYALGASSTAVQGTDICFASDKSHSSIQKLLFYFEILRLWFIILAIGLEFLLVSLTLYLKQLISALGKKLEKNLWPLQPDFSNSKGRGSWNEQWKPEHSWTQATMRTKSKTSGPQASQEAGLALQVAFHHYTLNCLSLRPTPLNILPPRTRKDHIPRKEKKIQVRRKTSQDANQTLGACVGQGLAKASEHSLLTHGSYGPCLFSLFSSPSNSILNH